MSIEEIIEFLEQDSAVSEALSNAFEGEEAGKLFGKQSNCKFPGPWGNNVPCGVDMWGAGTSLSLLAKCGVYRRPPKED